MASTKKASRGDLTPRDEYAAKRIIFPSICGGCGTRFRRMPTMQTGNLCKACRPRNKCEENESACSLCKYLPDCTARVSVGAWVLCEVPDAADIARLMRMEAFNGSSNRSALEGALAARGNRAILEAKISKVSATIYQRQITGSAGKVS